MATETPVIQLTWPAHTPKDIHVAWVESGTLCGRTTSAAWETREIPHRLVRESTACGVCRSLSLGI